MGWKLWLGIITSEKLFPLKVQVCGVAITTGGLLCSDIFGALRVFSVWGFTLYEMGDKFPIGESEGGIVCSDGGFIQIPN